VGSPTREFHRPARVIPAPVETGQVTVPAPPTIPMRAGGGLAMALLPVLGSVGMFGFALVMGETRYLVMAGVLAGAMVISGVTGRGLQVRQGRRAAAERVERYSLCLDEIRTTLERAAAAQHRWGQVAYPPVEDLWSVAVDGSRIWERRPEHEDFLTVRLGTGPVPAALRPVLAQGVDSLAEHEPAARAAAERLLSEFGEIDDGPALIDLADVGCLALVGDPEAGRATARALLVQLALFCAPDDLRMVVSCASSHLIEWSWCRRLPHLRIDSEPTITDCSEALAAILDHVAKPRAELLALSDSATPRRPRPHFPRLVVVLDGYDPASEIGRLEIVDDLLADARRLGVTFVCLTASPAQVPSDADITLNLDTAAIDPTGAQLELCAQIARMLEPLRLRTRTGRATSFESPGLLHLLGVEDGADLIDAGAWLDPDEQLTVPIGVAEDGSPLLLDLREAAAGGMGPHGMLIGATGSGKSELLRTLVLGLVARHHPDDLALVLVDFKGGATFGTLGSLPHNAGMITNLDREPGMIDRVMEALRGEMERRQRVLRRAGGCDRADAYRAQRRAHPEAGLEPLPSLVIVVDEFGELLAARPDFSELFAMIGRLGRSLGVHMLLSTQRLEDGSLRRLEGHLRYRLALRTFTNEESMAVIGSRAAAELPPVPGTGYLKVDGTMTAFKAALVSRASLGTDRIEAERIVEAWQQAPVEPVRPVWVDPLPETVTLDVLGEDAGWLRIPIGLEDQPRQQRRVPFVFDLTGRAGHVAVVGSPRSGKSTLLSTFVLSAASSHRPDDLHIYAIDFGGGRLALLEELPHVGAVLTRSHRAEIGKLLRRLDHLIDERAERYRHHRLTGPTGYHEIRREGAFVDELGEVLVVIDNWAGLAQELTTDQTDALGRIAAGGLHHGIHLVVSTNRWQDLRPSMRDNFGGRFELRLGDPLDSEIDRSASRAIPADMPGRGIGAGGAHVQVALPGSDDGDLEHAIDVIRRRNPDATGASPIVVLPEVVHERSLPPAESGGVVLGVEEHRLGPWEVDLFGADPHLLVLGDAESGRTNLLRRLIAGLAEVHEPSRVQIALVDYRRQLTHAVPEGHRFAAATSPETAATLAGRLAGELAARAGGEPSTGRRPAPALVVVVDDYDLVAGGTGNPLSPLTDRVAQGRDLGFHLVIARRVGGLTRSSFEPLLQRLRELNTPGVVLSGDPQEGPIFSGVRARSSAPGRGTWVARGRVTEVQAALCDDPPEAPALRLAGAAG
jgi:DNA segregation ATPase FtsK/SpoIIIE, S-DNA-T family